jgi:phage gpG-like protein
MAEVTLEFDGDEAIKWLEGMHARMRRATEPGQTGREFVGLLSAVVYRDVLEHFEDEQGPKGSWDDWSDVYADHLAAIGRGGNKMLQFTGRLRNSFKPGNVRADQTGFAWYNDAATGDGFPYAFAHNEGGPKLPKREFMWLSGDATARLAQITLAYVTEGK